VCAAGHVRKGRRTRHHQADMTPQAHVTPPRAQSGPHGRAYRGQVPNDAASAVLGLFTALLAHKAAEAMFSPWQPPHGVWRWHRTAAPGPQYTLRTTEALPRAEHTQTRRYDCRLGLVVGEGMSESLSPTTYRLRTKMGDDASFQSSPEPRPPATQGHGRASIRVAPAAKRGRCRNKEYERAVSNKVELKEHNFGLHTQR
jgi:hypothetical protein